MLLLSWCIAINTWVLFSMAVFDWQCFFLKKVPLLLYGNLIMADKNWFVSHIEVASNISGKSQGQLKYLSS